MLLGAVTACTGAADRPVPVPAAAAVVAYEAPAGAPAFCTFLAGSIRIAASHVRSERWPPGPAP